MNSLAVHNYAGSGEQSVLRETMFGPASEDVAILITISPVTGQTEITVGNGPDTSNLPLALPDVLHEVADLVADLQYNPEFWMAVGAYEEQRKSRYYAVDSDGQITNVIVSNN